MRADSAPKDGRSLIDTAGDVSSVAIRVRERLTAYSHYEANGDMASPEVNAILQAIITTNVTGELALVVKLFDQFLTEVKSPESESTSDGLL